MIRRGELEIHDDPHGDGIVAVMHGPPPGAAAVPAAAANINDAAQANGDAELRERGGGRNARRQRNRARNNGNNADVDAPQRIALQWSMAAKIGVLAILVYALAMLAAGFGFGRFFSSSE